MVHLLSSKMAVADGDQGRRSSGRNVERPSAECILPGVIGSRGGWAPLRTSFWLERRAELIAPASKNVPESETAETGKVRTARRQNSSTPQPLSSFAIYARRVAFWFTVRRRWRTTHGGAGLARSRNALRLDEPVIAVRYPRPERPDANEQSGPPRTSHRQHSPAVCRRRLAR
jgi:hypothetical protein